MLAGGIPLSMRGFPRNCESTNLSRDNLSREIGRTDSARESSLQKFKARAVRG